jgi:hypothetical protein
MKLIRALAILFAAAIPSIASADPVKMSGSSICHCPGGDYYDRTGSSRLYVSIDACLADGGRHPKSGQGSCQSASAAPAMSQPSTAVQAATVSSNRYDRDLFGGWADDDNDCQNTRHELLAQLSTGPVSYASPSGSAAGSVLGAVAQAALGSVAGRAIGSVADAASGEGCRVTRGRWNDPYTGKIYTEAKDLDIDHLVPLAYAWSRGAHSWSEAKRKQFANDPVNLYAVQARANRQKGAAGPTEWLPPNAAFHCEYLLRFVRVSKTYGLTFAPSEDQAISNLIQQKNCG